MEIDLSIPTEHKNLKSCLLKARKYHSDRKKGKVKGLEKEDLLEIDGSTFRAFRNCGVRPSELYREWRDKHGTELIKKFAKSRIRTRESFEKLHSNLVKSLEQNWKNKAKRELTTAEKFKLVDLFIKMVAFSKFSKPDPSEFLLQYGHIPLDKYSLIAVKKYFYGIKVNRVPSMGDIKDVGTYTFIQSQIYQLTSKLKMPNLYFDIIAWDLEHN